MFSTCVASSCCLEGEVLNASDSMGLKGLFGFSSVSNSKYDLSLQNGCDLPASMAVVPVLLQLLC